MAEPIYTLPPIEELEAMRDRTPDVMFPNTMPFAVVYDGGLTSKECDLIVEGNVPAPGYHYPGCGAETREYPYAHKTPELKVLEAFARFVNQVYYDFDLSEGYAAWMQTYKKDGAYQRHVDARPGHSRKLTAVLMLSAAEDYQGGSLQVFWPPETYIIPKTRGTVVVFPAWLHHAVMPVFSGVRRTINMGFYGPPFK